jgi:putative AlgH/UPF0301 family transcriptional regulator
VYAQESHCPNANKKATDLTPDCDLAVRGIARCLVSTPAKTTDRSLLAGQLLVSSPTIGDPRFDHTVILVVQHDQKGAFGIAINLPLEERPLASLLETLGAKDVTAASKVRIFAGGPVQPDIGFVIHSSDYRQPETVAIDSRTAMTCALHMSAFDPKRTSVVKLTSLSGSA